jgi:hypothetical protein
MLLNTITIRKVLLVAIIVMTSGRPTVLAALHHKQLVVTERKQQETTVNVQLLREHIPPVPCPKKDEAHWACFLFMVKGDWTGNALARFPQFEVDKHFDFIYSGYVDFDIQGDDDGSGGIQGSATFEVTNGVGVLTKKSNHPEDDGPLPLFYNITSDAASGDDAPGTGYFSNHKCTLANKGSIDPFRKPYAEILDSEGSCVLIP